jgi:hypothetical protein
MPKVTFKALALKCFSPEMSEIIRRFGITTKSKALSSYSICKIFIYDYF